MHITGTIIERSLVLDTESIEKVQHHLQQEYPPRSAPRCVQRQIKLAVFLIQRERVISVLKEWGSIMWKDDKNWPVAFCVFVMLTLVMDKTVGSAYYFCENRIANRGYEASSERSTFGKLVRLTQTELFERCKEIFHWKYKTRKGGKEAINPIRDGRDAFKGKAANDGDNDGVISLVGNLQTVVREFGKVDQF